MIAAATALVGVATTCAHAQDMVLVSSKVTPTIVVGAGASASERFAATELSTYLAKITGRTVAVVDDTRVPDGTLIAVGKSRLTDDIEVASLGIEEFVIRARPRLLTIVGGRLASIDGKPRDRGTLYGVYEFLDGLGVRWYRPEPWGEYVPQMKTVTIPLGTRRAKPQFAFRASDDSYGGGGDAEKEAMTQLWAVRNRQNAYLSSLKPEYGGKVDRSYGHSFESLLPHGEYFNDHPEYFALLDGKRSADPSSQFCVSNPDVQRIVADAIIAEAKANPYADAFALEPNDSGRWCECENCKAMDGPEQLSEWQVPSATNRLTEFRNIIAKRVAEQCPGVQIGCLAYYSHTEAPLQVKHLEPNVAMQICSYLWTYCDYSKRLTDATSRQNSAFLREARRWSAMCKDLTTYEYWEGYLWLGPLPVVSVMSDRLREYRKLGIRGTYREMVNKNWGAQHLPYFMYGKLMWNPEIDVRRELDLYYRNYFGPAAEPMKAYHELLEKTATRRYWGSCGYRFVTLLDDDLLARLGRYIDRARFLVAGSDLYEKRFEGAAAGYEYARRRYLLYKNSRDGKIDAAIAAGDELLGYMAGQQGRDVFDDNAISPDSPSIYCFTKDEVRVLKEKRGASPFVNARPVQNLDDGWKFHADPDSRGLDSGWSSAYCDDSSWSTITASGGWVTQGHADYTGTAWYRRTIEIAGRNEGARVALYFGGADGDIDLWVNGRHIGYHLDDEVWWDTPVWFDVTDALVDGVNHIAVKSFCPLYRGGTCGLWGGAKLLVGEARNP